jgi:translation initiation factor IF-2
VAFNVSTPRPMLQLAQTQSVPILSSDIIYRLMETVQSKVVELLPPIIEFKVTGEANVQAMFEIDMGKKVKLKVAGARVTNGTLEKGKSVRLMRGGEIVHDGQ